MLLSNTASIGQAVLRAAIRLQNTHIEYQTYNLLDPARSGCYDCLKHLQDPSACDYCPSRVYQTTTKKVYSNERARFGERKTLNHNSLNLFILLHFQFPDSNGLVRMFDAEEAAETLHCHVRTVMNNLKNLQNAGYISFVKTDIPYSFHVFLSEYKTYFKKASEGGRGYLRMSKDLFCKILQLSTINGTRLAVRNLIYSLDEKRKGRSMERSYKEIQQDLPDYCTKKQIIDITSTPTFADMFSVTSKKRSMAIRIRDQYNQHQIAELLIEDGVAAAKQWSASIAQAHDASPITEPAFSLTAQEVKDIGNIALRLPVWTITRALDKFYNKYIKQNLPYDKVGALVRSFAEDEFAAAV